MIRTFIFFLVSAISLQGFGQLSVPEGTITNSNNNNVGIGTYTPQTKLHVEDNANGWLQSIKGTAVSPEDFLGLKIQVGYPGEYGKWAGITAIAADVHGNQTHLGFYSTQTERMRLTNEGRLGIGITNPASQLHVFSDQDAITWPAIINNHRNSPSVSNYGVGVKLKHSANSEVFKWGGIASIQEDEWANNSGLALYANETEYLRIKHNGNVGIGTTNPGSKLDVNGPARIANTLSLLWWSNPNVGYGHTSIAMNGDRVNGQWQVFGDGARSSIGLITTDIFSNIRFITHHDPGAGNGKTMSDEDLVNNYTRMIITEPGNVGIGTTWTGSHRLAVEGSIGAREIKVQAPPGWPDYVFSPNYELRTLEETKTYIEENQHLPEIPSAAEMEANGVALGEMNMLLLKKIEELTLYVIKLESKNIEQDKLIQNLLNNEK